jgi:hypothetical protein
MKLDGKMIPLRLGIALWIDVDTNKRDIGGK